MTFSWWTFLFEALNFVVLAYVLRRLLYRPLRDAIDKRKEANARAQTEAEAARKNAESLQQQLKDQLAATEQERQEIMHKAHEQADSERTKLLAQVQQAAQRRQEEVTKSLELERAEAIKSLHGELVAQAIELTRRLLSQSSDRSLHQQLALRLVQNLRQLPMAEREQLRMNRPSDDGAVLESAQDLDAGALEQLTETVTSILGQPVSIVVQRRPELLDGVRLRLGGQVWDCSLAGQLNGADASAGKVGRP